MTGRDAGGPNEADPAGDVTFQAVADPSEGVCRVAASLDPTNHSYTYPFTQAMKGLGREPWMLSLTEGPRTIVACTAFLTSGRVNRGLEIVSLPTLPPGRVFWDGLLTRCRRLRVSHLVLSSFGSSVATIPPLPGERVRTARCEHVLRLDVPSPWKALASNHARNVKSARKAGVVMRQAGGVAACERHAELLQASAVRRRERGEAIASEHRVPRHMAFTETGAGEIYQAVLEDCVVSSMLVLRAAEGAYYQTAGTSPEGMACGASHFLVYEIAEHLRGQGIKQFNLGGAMAQNAGLYRFKRGFGTEERFLEAAECYVGSQVQRMLTGAASALRNHVRRLAR